MSYRYAVIDIETTGLNRYKDNINYIGVGFAKSIKSKNLDKVLILNMYENKDLRRWKKVIAYIKENKVTTITQNGKFDTLFIEHKLGDFVPLCEDIMLMGTAFDLVASHKLKDMAENYLGTPNYDIPLKEKIKPNNPIVEKYLVSDLEEPWGLFRFFKRAMDEHQIKVYRYLLKPAELAYKKIEREGIYLDVEQLKVVKKKYQNQHKNLGNQLQDIAEINWNSSAQVGKVLFEELTLPVIKRSPKTGSPSSDAKSLRRLAQQGFEVPQLLLDYKFYNGALTKFLNTWPKDVAPDGRIHPSFKLTNVRTGRTSCSSPNLQQVPRNAELRSLFTATEGRTLIEADYSQLELRIAADYSQDPTMLEIYRTNGDIHTETAKDISRSENPDKTMRTRAKAVNFGFLYGMQAPGFANYAFDSYGVSLTKDEAEQYRNDYFNKYDTLLYWHKDVISMAKRLGGVYNRFGRFRRLPNINSHNFWDRSSDERIALNTPVQGTGSDLLLLAVAELYPVLKDYGAKIVCTVHDSMLVDCPEWAVEDVCKEITAIMENPTLLDFFEVSFSVPLIADVKVGAWGK